MHVGHLRSTVIGDYLARVLGYIGHEVIRQNHVGDWGTQFGMLIEDLLETMPVLPPEIGLAELGGMDQAARLRFTTDDAFRERARERVVALQSGDDETMRLWHELVSISAAGFQSAYDRLGVLLTSDDVAGESSYNDALPRVVADLEAAGLLTESDGAMCVFLPDVVTREGAPLPTIIRKADGGFGHDATDLAAVRHRIHMLRADRLIYVVDARQALHFDQLFAVAREVRWLTDSIDVSHVAFATVLGEDGKPFMTKEGTPVPLAALLDAAEGHTAPCRPQLCGRWVLASECCPGHQSRRR
jgi:arginyl-tRNA synthetase